MVCITGKKGRLTLELHLFTEWNSDLSVDAKLLKCTLNNRAHVNIEEVDISFVVGSEVVLYN